MTQVVAAPHLSPSVPSGSGVADPPPPGARAVTLPPPANGDECFRVEYDLHVPRVSAPPTDRRTSADTRPRDSRGVD